jgi:hypothetical protein
MLPLCATTTTRPSEPHTPSPAAHHSRSRDQDELVGDQWWADRPSTPSYRVSPCLWPHVVAVCHHHHHHLRAPHAFSFCLVLTVCTLACFPPHACLGELDRLVGGRWWAAPPSAPPYLVPPCLWPHVVAVYDVGPKLIDFKNKVGELIVMIDRYRSDVNRAASSSTAAPSPARRPLPSSPVRFCASQSSSLTHTISQHAMVRHDTTHTHAHARTQASTRRMKDRCHLTVSFVDSSHFLGTGGHWRWHVRWGCGQGGLDFKFSRWIVFTQSCQLACLLANRASSVFRVQGDGVVDGLKLNSP